MNQKEAMEALLAGKKIRNLEWDAGYFIHLIKGEIRTVHGDRLGLSPYITYELYKEPAPKQKFYRRTWVTRLFPK